MKRSPKIPSLMTVPYQVASLRQGLAFFWERDRRLLKDNLEHAPSTIIPCELRDSSHGKGVFILRAVAANERIMAFQGGWFTKNTLPQPYLPDDDYYLQIGEDLFLGPSGCLDDFVNHSCNPNCFVGIEPDGIFLVSLKKIVPETELFFDYSVTMHRFPYVMKCHCGSPLCRGEVRDFSDLPQPVKNRYAHAGIVPEYVLRRH